MTQCQAVLAYMRQHGSITQREADKLGVARLAPRMGELEAAGGILDRLNLQVHRCTIKVRKANGKDAHVTRYTLTPAHVGLSSSPTAAATPDQQGGLFYSMSRLYSLAAPLRC